jgi:hypothetical protein
VAAKYPAIPEPVAEINSVRDTSAALKETVEVLTQQRGTRSLSAVTWQDLLALGLISPDQVPKTPTAGR